MLPVCESFYNVWVVPDLKLSRPLRHWRMEANNTSAQTGTITTYIPFNFFGINQYDLTSRDPDNLNIKYYIHTYGLF